MPSHCVEWTAIPEATSSDGVAKKAMVGKQVSLVRVTIPAGTEAPRHSHPFEQFVQVVSGSGRLETEEGLVRFEAGSVFHFPPGTWHEALFDTETVLIETNLAG